MAEVKAADASSEPAHEELLNDNAAVVEAQGGEEEQGQVKEEGQQQQQDPQSEQQPGASGLDSAAAAAATLGVPLPSVDPAAAPVAAPPLLPPGLISVADLTAGGAVAVPIPLPLLPAAAAADATRIGSGPGGQALTFNWTSPPEQDGHRLYYTSFQFCDARYRVGDHVYLIPEDTNAPLYLARIISAFEDTVAEGSEKLCIEVQWYERRANMPENLQAGMHDREVVEWLQTDTNLVGCIERKARVIKARSYEEAVAQLSPEEAAGDWHFCRGALDCETLTFFTYDQIDADPNLTYDQRNGMVITATAAMAAAASRASRQAMLFAAGNGAMPGMDVELFQPAGAASSGKRGGRGGRRGGSGGGGGGRRGARQPRTFSGTGEGGIPGQICCECGATSTPQWREGPGGPRTLCNACGMRYQRSQGKGVNRPRRAGSGDGTGSGGPERKSARTTRGRGRGKGRYSSRYDDPFDDEDDEDSADLELTDDDD